MDVHNVDFHKERLEKLPVQLTVRICGRSLKLSEFLDWVPGTVLSFGQSGSSTLNLCIGNQTIGEGQAVKIGSRIGLKINKL